MRRAALNKIISKSVYNKRSKEFSLTFKDSSISELFQLLMPNTDRRKFTKTVKFKVNDDTKIEEIITFLDLTTDIK